MNIVYCRIISCFVLNMEFVIAVFSSGINALHCLVLPTHFIVYSFTTATFGILLYSVSSPLYSDSPLLFVRKTGTNFYYQIIHSGEKKKRTLFRGHFVIGEKYELLRTIIINGHDRRKKKCWKMTASWIDAILRNAMRIEKTILDLVRIYRKI